MTRAACSIVIPVHNRASLTRQCLNHLLAEESAQGFREIIVVDDASTDVTPRVLGDYGDQIRVVRRSANQGFARSCNDGAAAASGEYLIFLNNDTMPTDGWLDALVRYASAHPEAAAIGAKLLFPDATVQHAGIVVSQDRIPRHIYAGFPAHHPAVNTSRRFQMVTAACVLMRRGPFEEMDGFSADFVNGYEDVDLCLRLGERGYEVHYCHESELYHLESVTRGYGSYEYNHQLYLNRWSHRVRPDEFDYYVADGLMTLSYWEQFPISMSISPLLATVDRDGDDVSTDRVVLARARRAFEALKENTRLRLLAHEAGLVDGRAALSVDDAGPNEPVVGVRATPTRLRGQRVDQLISIVMPVKNAERRLRELLPRILEQDAAGAVELVAVDSGSSDGTVELLTEFGATVVSIDPRSFNHGLTRQLAASHATGDVLVFLNSTAVPADERWLATLIAPLRHDARLAGVCSRVVPPPGADYLARKDGLRDPSASPVRVVREITDWRAYKALAHHELRLFINFHTVSAAIRPQIVREIPFREVRTIGEDILWAKEVLEAGYRIQHEPTSIVFHLHRYSYGELLQLNVDDGLANRDVVGRTLAAQELFPMIESMTRDDWRYLSDECGLAGPELEHWQLVAVLRRAAQAVGQWIGANPDRVPGELLRTLSRIERTKAGRPPDLFSP